MEPSDTNGHRPVYRGVPMRSMLEVRWAMALDMLGIVWQYEPRPVLLPSGRRYRPDFWLPELRTWLEVKGPGIAGLDKAEELARIARHGPECGPPGNCGAGGCPYSQSPYQLVVVGMAPQYGYAHWRMLDTALDLKDFWRAIFRCRACYRWWWPVEGDLRCRACGVGDTDGADAFMTGSVAGRRGDPGPGLPFDGGPFDLPDRR